MATASASASASAPVPVRRADVVDGQRIYGAALVPNGQVLVDTDDGVFVWSPEKHLVEKKVTGHAFAGLRTGETRFVVGRVTEGKVALELWDAAGVTKIKTLDGTWWPLQSESDRSDYLLVFGPERTFVYLGCSGHDERWTSTGCEACAYTLDDGAACERRTKTGPLFVLAHRSMLVVRDANTIELGEPFRGSGRYDLRTGTRLSYTKEWRLTDEPEAPNEWNGRKLTYESDGGGYVLAADQQTWVLRPKKN